MKQPSSSNEHYLSEDPRPKRAKAAKVEDSKPVAATTVELFRFYRGICMEQQNPRVKLHLLSNYQVKFEEEGTNYQTVPHGSWDKIGDVLHLSYHSWKGNDKRLEQHAFEAVHSGALTVYRHLRTSRAIEEQSTFVLSELELIPWIDESDSD
jgi:hypothetical protein